LRRFRDRNYNDSKSLSQLALPQAEGAHASYKIQNTVMVGNKHDTKIMQ